MTIDELRAHAPSYCRPESMAIDYECHECGEWYDAQHIYLNFLPNGRNWNWTCDECISRHWLQTAFNGGTVAIPEMFVAAEPFPLDEPPPPSAEASSGVSVSFLPACPTPSLTTPSPTDSNRPDRSS